MRCRRSQAYNRRVTPKLALLAPTLLLALQGPASTPSATPSPVAPAMVSIELSLQALDAKGEVPRTLQAGDVMVVDGDQPRPVAELAPLARPWRIVIYVDRVL